MTLSGPECVIHRLYIRCRARTGRALSSGRACKGVSLKHVLHASCPFGGGRSSANAQ